MLAELIIRGKCQLFIHDVSDSRKRRREAIYAKTTWRLMRPRRMDSVTNVGDFFVN